LLQFLLFACVLISIRVGIVSAFAFGQISLNKLKMIRVIREFYFDAVVGSKIGFFPG